MENNSPAAEFQEPDHDVRKQRQHRQLLLLLAFCFFMTLIVTFPLILDLSAILDFHQDGKFRYFQDQLQFIEYVKAIKWKLQTGGSVWGIIFYDPNYAIPPSYAITGGVLAFIINPVAVYNLFFMLWTFLAFLCMFLYAYKLTDSRVGSYYAALIFGLSNYLVLHILDGHQHYTQVFLIPLIFLVSEKIFEKPDYRNAVYLGLSLGLLILSAAQYTLYMAILLPIYIFIRKPKIYRDKKIITTFLLSLIPCLLLSGYYIYLKLQYDSKIYTIEENIYFSLHSLTEFIDPSKEDCIGIVPIILAIIAVVALFKQKKQIMIPLLTVIAVGTILMAGPFHYLAPYYFLYKFFPVFDHVRTPRRFTPFVFTAIAVLSAFGIDYICQKVKRKWFWPLVIGTIILTLVTCQIHSQFFTRSKTGKSIWIRKYPLKMEIGK